MTAHTPRADARVASTLFLAGAVLLFVGNTAHPVDADPSATSRLELASTSVWTPIHLVIAVGVVLVVGAFVLLQRVVVDPRAAAHAHLGAVSAVVGGTMLVIVFGALDGYGNATLAGAWQTATDVQRDGIATAALVLDTIDSGMAAVGTLMLFGLALTAFGYAMLVDRTVARWLGAAALVLGAAGTVTGVAFALQGPTATVINLLFRPVAMAATVYFVALGVALRRQRRPAPDPAAG